MLNYAMAVYHTSAPLPYIRKRQVICAFFDKGCLLHAYRLLQPLHSMPCAAKAAHTAISVFRCKFICFQFSQHCMVSPTPPRARGMGIPLCSPDHTEGGNGRPDHFHLARPHPTKSRVIHRIIARTYFQSIARRLDAILDRKEQGPEGQGYWHAAEPVQEVVTKIHMYINGNANYLH